jgi:hypothetical protein
VRYFNTTGPCRPEEHYMLPAVERLPEAVQLAEAGRYFIVHAPRQTGKTTIMESLARELTAEGKHAALRFSCESGEAAESDYGAAEFQVLNSIRRAARWLLPPEFWPPDPWPDAEPGSRLFAGLQDWAVACPLPLVLVFDEIDALQGQSLISALRQLRDGFSYRAQAFPKSVVLCGMRDLEDYRVASGGAPGRIGTASPFNIALDSLRIGNFTIGEVAALYGQHTAETGQEFTAEAVERAFDYSQGQPWLVNDLAFEITSPLRMGIKPPAAITAEHIDAAKERLILNKRTHLSSLSAKLHEPRVKRFIEPMLAGASLGGDDNSFDEDLQYVRDLGLIASNDPVRIANPIYREVIARTLAARTAAQVFDSPARFVLPDGRLDFPLLLQAFADFWVDSGAEMAGKEAYREASVQVVFMGFLQRIVNGGGFVDREYSLGTGRTDILVRKPYGDGQMQREFIELKVWLPKKGDPLDAGLQQLDNYLKTARLNVGTLVIFDRRKTALPVAERTEITHLTSPARNAVTLLRA